MSYQMFEDLPVWVEAKKYVMSIYTLSKGRFNNDYELMNQIRRASLSIVLNIAEGFERRSDREFAYFLNIAKGSAGETRAILYVAKDLGYIDDIEYQLFLDGALSLSRQLSKFREYLLRR